MPVAVAVATILHKMVDTNCSNTFIGNILTSNTEQDDDNISLRGGSATEPDDQTNNSSITTTKVQFKPNNIKYFHIDNNDPFNADVVTSAEHIFIEEHPIATCSQPTMTTVTTICSDKTPPQTTADEIFAHNVMLLAGNDFDKICRGCLTKSADLQPIFDSGLSDMMMAFAAIQVLRS